MEKGHKAIYKYSEQMFKGTHYVNYVSEVYISNETKTLDGKTYYISQNASGEAGGDQTIIQTYYRISSDGTIYYKDTENSEDLIWMSGDPSIGETHPTANGGTSKVISLDGTVTTPKGSYSDCLVIETSENQTTYRAYFIENTGMIASTMVVGSDEKIFIYISEK